MKKVYMLCFLICMALLNGCKYQSKAIASSSNNSFQRSDNIDSNSFSNSVATNSIQGSESMSTADSQDQKIIRDRVSEILNRASTKDYNNLLNLKISALDFGLRYLNYNYNPLMSYLPTISGINQDFKIECLRKTSESTAYSIHETGEDGLFYSFFTHEEQNLEWNLSCAIYSRKKLSYNNFDTIKKDTSISAVETIDPATSLEMNIAAKNSLTKLTSKHLLTDGLLVIDYLKNDAGQFIVTDKKYYEDNKITVNSSASDSIIYDYTILKQDFIH